MRTLSGIYGPFPPIGGDRMGPPQPATGVPVPDFTADDTTITTGGSVAFTDTSETEGKAPARWNWDFGDGTGSTLQSPTHQYDVGGIYTVRMIATNVSGSGVKIKTGYITVTDP